MVFPSVIKTRLFIKIGYGFVLLCCWFPEASVPTYSISYSKNEKMIEAPFVVSGIVTFAEPPRAAFVCFSSAKHRAVPLNGQFVPYLP